MSKEADSTGSLGSPLSGDPGTTTLRGLVALDNACWVRLVQQYFDQVYGWAKQGGLDDHAAADVAQEVFVAALGSLHRFQRDGESNFTGWLRRICQRRVVDYIRADKVRASGGTDALNQFYQLASVREQLDPSGSTRVSNERLLAAIAIAQTEFESKSWQAFWMTIVDQRVPDDVASDLGITRNAVYLSKSRILKRLREILEAC